ncbi:MAG: hypothetical protein KBT11_01355 [Treponema sp.]|nr:hypothetical protein [Candidatus Treponema equifaecale]
MKTFGLIAVLSALFIFEGTVFAQDNSSDWKLAATTDFAYYPKSDFVTGDSHFAPITGPYYTLECRETFSGTKTISVPLGDHFLLKDGNIAFVPACELTPIFIKPKFQIDYTPLPFLIFSGGASVGTGWNFFGFKGMQYLNEKTGEFDNLTTFKNLFSDIWGGVTFQFDTGALIPGDWSHVVMQACAKFTYESMSGIDDGDIWYWQSRFRVNGLYHSGSVTLAYQMPIALYRAGLMFEWFGYCNGNDYGKYADSFDGEFVQYDISLLTQWTITQKDSLIMLLNFGDQRSYAESHDDYFDEIKLTKTGREWLFKRIVFRWVHNF